MVSPDRDLGLQYPFLVKKVSQCNLILTTRDEPSSMVNNAAMISPQESKIMHNPVSSSSSSSSSCSSQLIFKGNSNGAGGSADTRCIEDVCWNAPMMNTTPLPPPEIGAGEMTFEEYLIRTGAVNGNRGFHRNDQNAFPLMMGSDLGSKLMDLGYLENQLKMTTMTAEMAGKSIRSMPESDRNSYNNTKLSCKDERLAKTVERRQRRMIKNRESAARSRARKQAYTNQLQQQVSRLQKTNEWLKKRKEVYTILDSNSASGPRYQLRRTSSSEF